MSFDPKKTVALIQGGLFDPRRTWQSYLAENPRWQTTAVVLTVPLLAASVLLTMFFTRLTGGWSMYSLPGASLMVATIVALAMGVLGLVVLTVVLAVLAGPFGGKRDFDRAFAAVSLALIPGYVASPVAALVPWVGFLIGLAGFIVSLVFLYRIMPLALEVPGGKRVAHYVLSLAAAFVVNLVAGSVISTAFYGDAIRDSGTLTRQQAGRAADPGMGGWVGEMERQSRLVEAAQADRYQPPPGGEVTDAQVVRLLDVMRKTRSAQQDYSQRMEAMAREMENRQSASLADLGKVYSGVAGAVGAHNVEMEIVKSSGANWAEHQWVKEQLRTAMLHRGTGSTAIERNYRHFQAHEAELREAL